MSEIYILVTIILSEPQLDDEELQEAVDILRDELQEVDGVIKADLIPVEETPPGSKGFAGFLPGKLKVSVKPENLNPLLVFLSRYLSGRTIDIEAEETFYGKKLRFKISRPEDLYHFSKTMTNFVGSYKS